MLSNTFLSVGGPIAVGLGVRTIGASIITDAVLAAPYDNYRIYNGPQNPVLIIRGPYIKIDPL